MSGPLTTEGKEAALAGLADRRANKPERIRNEDLPAGSNMFFYCQACGHCSDVLPENYFISQPKKLCGECQALQDLGWLE